MRLAAFRQFTWKRASPGWGLQLTPFHKEPKRASAPPCLLPQQFFRSSRQLRRRLPALHQTNKVRRVRSSSERLHRQRGAQRAIHDFRAEPAGSRRQTGVAIGGVHLGRTSTGAHLLLLSEDLFRVASVSISALIVLFAVSGAIFYLVTIYNGLVTMRNDIDKSWANI